MLMTWRVGAFVRPHLPIGVTFQLVFCKIHFIWPILLFYYNDFSFHHHYPNDYSYFPVNLHHSNITMLQGTRFEI